MTATTSSERGFSKAMAVISLGILAIVVTLPFFGVTIRRFVRESLMQRVTSAHYEILCPPKELSQEAMTDFAKGRERLFSALNKKLGDVDSNLEIRIVFDPTFPAQVPDAATRQPYSVTGTTIRTKLSGQTPQLPAAADAEALLYAGWGPPGNPQIARWIAIWLVGKWNGDELGMAAAQVEQRLGHKKVQILLADPGGEISSPKDQALLGAAWVSEIAEFGGAGAVKKLYAAKMPHPNVAEVTQVLGTTPLELDRKWQMWMYSYLAGMPTVPGDSDMPTDMPMPGENQ
jgi:hypothetical protein